jgi:hypothetical protein
VGKHFWADEDRSRETTVRATLIELGASLHDGKVVDASGEELYFFSVMDAGARGRVDYEENQKRLREAEEKFHVVRMYGPKVGDDRHRPRR